ncbi:hypothetical protein [Actinokineospora xionganensis]|uniref:Uncharacterized protein n=1 Tax=Actinokineospora xionganensis TaxID=2684470 RepID=A0ABR7LGI4_9PSEU|nr:hypothetical protein [Actinokineospora xionganensis]MBC6451598.1 hypothetical protein [Actinokineospora xionganensis]
MLPTHLRWTVPRPPYRLDPQDLVTLVVLDPRLHVSTDEEDRVEFSYHCFNHARAYIHGSATRAHI